MEINGKIIAALPVRQGTSAKGDWQAQSYVLEYASGQYMRHIVFDVFGAEKIQQFAIVPGETVQVSIDLDARESNGRWFNSIKAWNIQRVTGQQPVYQQQAPVAAQPSQYAPQPQQAPAQPQPQQIDEGKLPF